VKGLETGGRGREGRFWQHQESSEGSGEIWMWGEGKKKGEQTTWGGGTLTEKISGLYGLGKERGERKVLAKSEGEKKVCSGKPGEDLKRRGAEPTSGR